MKVELSQLIELYNGGKHKELEAACQVFLGTHQQHAYAWHLAAANAMQLGHFEQGIERVEVAIKLQPEEISFYNTLGSIYRQLGKKQDSCDR